MALVAGTLTRYGGSPGATQVPQGLRESLSDMIYNISPTKTPFMSGAGVGKPCKQALEEWQTDTLAAVDGANAQLEGDEAAYTTPAASVRVGNYLQISRKTVNVSDSLEEVDKAGRRSQMALETMKRGKELKRDMETIFLQAQAGAAGGISTARTLAGLNAWVKSNVDYHTTTGGNPGYTSGVPDAVRTDGTQRGFTETILKAVLQSGFTNGAEFSTLMVGPFNKSVVSGFAGIAQKNFDLSKVGKSAIIASADVYVGEFDTVRVIPNRFQRERDAWLIDWDMVSVRYLRPFKAKPMAKTGDSDKKLLIVEYTLEVKNEAGLGLCADLTTS